MKGAQMTIARESLQDELDALVRAGNYPSQEAAVSHALEVLLAANRDLRVRTAVELYREEKVTAARAAEIAGLDREGFREVLKAAGVEIVIDESAEDIRTGAQLITRLRAAG
jgi:predicted HTH domain antitoxin